MIEWKQKYNKSLDLLKASKRKLSDKQTVKEVFFEEDNDCRINEQEHISPYSIVNLVGHPILVTSQQQSSEIKIEDQHIEDIVLDKNEDDLFSTAKHMSIFQGFQIQVAVQFNDELLRPRDCIRVDELIERDLFLAHSNTALSKIVCRIHERGMKRCITFTSVVQITNCIGSALLVMLLLQLNLFTDVVQNFEERQPEIY